MTLVFDNQYICISKRIVVGSNLQLELIWTCIYLFCPVYSVLGFFYYYYKNVHENIKADIKCEGSFWYSVTWVYWMDSFKNFCNLTKKREMQNTKQKT